MTQRILIAANNNQFGGKEQQIFLESNVAEIQARRMSTSLLDSVNTTTDVNPIHPQVYPSLLAQISNHPLI